MMLPEHVTKLRQRTSEQKKIAKHELDEQELQEIGYVVMDALNHTLEVRVIYWADWAYNELVGYIAKVDLQLKSVRFEKEDGDIEIVPIDCIKSVERL